MPIIRVEMLKGRTAEQKQELADNLTTAFIESCGGNAEKLNIIITEVDSENWAIGGALLANKPPKTTS